MHDQRTANFLSKQLSLRKPQHDSLQILADILSQLGLSQDPDLQHWLTVIQKQYPSVKDFERTFPSLCFALATGVGKTRLMGAMIAWLYPDRAQPAFYGVGAQPDYLREIETGFHARQSEICICRYSRTGANAAGHYYW
ncbi:MAG: hypothetical protein ACXV74_14380 [Methylobacter sp.]